jgi:transposase
LAVTATPANENEKNHAPKLIEKRFKAHGPERLKRLYRHKASAERAISRLKQHLNLENHEVRGLRNILTHALLCIIAMPLLALTAIKLRKPEQIRAITRVT